ncbi:recombinase family protein [Nonomuraea sp. K274]|uniref:Recombinase family protein n=1 Tax=Nonomuraea cypriaca TaxID=1187855 RepID=A0A931A8Q5_9ACTN|nr:recombinase family protein [Nonomuraea cypriaca]MBF8188326.1 recombinase family protein [Nonomuraea cypriaca]
MSGAVSCSGGGRARIRGGPAGQLLDRQMAALTAVGCIRVFADKKSGKNAEREELWKALDYLRPGDTLVAPSLDRPCRRTTHGASRDVRSGKLITHSGHQW